MISIILPCYNVEKEIDLCVDSILKQTYSDFELIAIDDGSIDGTLKKLQDFSKEDRRVRVYQQKNAGPSAARNKGIELARGEYIAFCDSDDYIGEEYLEHLCNRTKEECDIVISGFNYVSTNGKIIKIPGIELSCKKEIFFDKFYAQSIARRLIFGPINKLYKRKILIEEKIRFNTELKIREDGMFVLEFLKYCSSFEGIRDAEYYYVQHEENTSLISKLNEDEIHINSKFYNAMVGLKENLRKEDVIAICSMFLNMDISLITKYYNTGYRTFIEGYSFVKEIHKDKAFIQARHMLKKYDWKIAFRYYCPIFIEVLVKGIKQRI